MAEGNSFPASGDAMDDNDDDLVKKLPSIPSSDEVSTFEVESAALPERWVHGPY